MSERSIVLSWAVLKWYVQSDRQGGVSANHPCTITLVLTETGRVLKAALTMAAQQLQESPGMIEINLSSYDSDTPLRRRAALLKISPDRAVVRKYHKELLELFRREMTYRRAERGAIAAIKPYREINNASLMDAKTIIDNIRYSDEPQFNWGKR